MKCDLLWRRRIYRWTRQGRGWSRWWSRRRRGRCPSVSIPVSGCKADCLHTHHNLAHTAGMCMSAHTCLADPATFMFKFKFKFKIIYLTTDGHELTYTEEYRFTHHCAIWTKLVSKYVNTYLWLVMPTRNTPKYSHGRTQWAYHHRWQASEHMWHYIYDYSHLLGRSCITTWS